MRFPVLALAAIACTLVHPTVILAEDPPATRVIARLNAALLDALQNA